MNPARPKWCNLCGTELPEGATVCQECGAEVAKTQKRFVSPTAKCPFYRREMNLVILCRSPIQDCAMRLCFANGTAKRIHSHDFCCSDFTACPYYRVNIEKNGKNNA